MTQGFFVTGTDTGVGKTIASAWLTLHTSGIYWKPVQTGTRIDPLDQDVVGALVGYEHILPSSYVFPEPLAPLYAAECENTSIPMDNLVLPFCDRPLIVEGAGGVMVPVTPSNHMVDLMAQFQLPVVVVARTTLGTINHTLLTLEALKRRNIPITGIILNGPDESYGQRGIESFGGVPILGHLPVLKEIKQETLQGIKPWVNLLQHSL